MILGLSSPVNSPWPKFGSFYPFVFWEKPKIKSLIFVVAKSALRAFEFLPFGKTLASVRLNFMSKTLKAFEVLPFGRTLTSMKFSLDDEAKPLCEASLDGEVKP